MAYKRFHGNILLLDSSGNSLDFIKIKNYSLKETLKEWKGKPQIGRNCIKNIYIYTHTYIYKYVT